MCYEKDPLYKKALYISELMEQFSDFVLKGAVDIQDDNIRDTWIRLAHSLREMSSKMVDKVISGVEEDLYDAQMEFATFIRYYSNAMMAHFTSLEIHGFKDTEYLDLFRNEIDEFRLLFVAWVDTFNQWSYVVDKWGLFNPPGVRFDDPIPEGSVYFEKYFDEIDDFGEIDPDEWDELDEEDED